MKKTLFILILLFSTVLLPSLGIAEDEKETITIVTYFPTPYGAYNEVKVQEGIVFKPQDDISSISGKEGELVYGKLNAFATENKFYYYNGSDWVEF